MGFRSASVTTVRARAPRADEQLVDRLRRGDQDAFSQLLGHHHRAMLRVAQLFVRERAVAEEVVQDTWLAVLEGIDRFEARSSLRTWIYRILTNRAKTRAERERRTVPESALVEDDPYFVEVPERRFRPLDDPNRPHAWAMPPRAWPEERLLARESVAAIRDALTRLPLAQQVVVGLRDVEGWTAEEVCEALDVTPGNQRVLLHRARATLRNELERYFEDRCR
jgi:RNA polymerase sigma-70 factor, ECF subfamily